MSRQFNKIGTQRAEMSAAYQPPIPSTNFLFKYMRLNGATSGSDGMNSTIGTSTAPAVFSYVCPANRIAYIHRCNVSHRDVNFPPAKYGSSTLANGILVDAFDTNTSGVLIDFTDNDKITAMGEWTHLAGIDMTLQSGTGPLNDDHMGIRWTLWNAGGSLELTSGQAIRFQLHDDMSYLSHMDAMVQGTIWASTDNYGST